jgi:hypothetical protein
MGPPLYMQSVIDRNIVMWRTTVLAQTMYIFQVVTMCVTRVIEQDKLSLNVMLIFK